MDVSQEGFLYQSELPLKECTSLVVQTIGEYQREQVELNSAEISTLFFFSFGLVLLSYKSAWIVGVIKNVIGKI
ncbi:hypothetical protein [Photobacterium sanguinicancri]|uniref:hypothetical protein n=1 Tax=Photobacterium sanguinicancri TaxID=875932 RepID=UPI0026E3025E|nr:hypothetical protein [Photobacterium sanguinicancri]MDO6499247.1 hypothetical protein [Photobacterium sanguinicancri]MDO6499255.1 hypothetical protein [Photobacterium sanguinicancri]